MKTQWHLSRIRSHDYENKKRKEMIEKKPYVCKFCKWRTDSKDKMNKHIAKFDLIFVHGIDNPHKLWVIENKCENCGKPNSHMVLLSSIYPHKKILCLKCKEDYLR